MIDGVVKLSSTTVKDIMVPRPDVVFVSVDAEPDELLDTIAESGHSRLPVYHKTVDDVIGVLYAKDLLGQVVGNGQKANAGKAMRKPYFVPESKRVDELLHEFQRRRSTWRSSWTSMAARPGSPAWRTCWRRSWATYRTSSTTRARRSSSWVRGSTCATRLWLDELADYGLTMALPADEFDTLGGFVFDLFGKIPVIYETKSYGNADFVIQGMEGRRITRVKIVVRREPEGDPQQDRSA
ncbi:Magnesium and cobalt efflux protein CorC [Geodia barretti]|uniref:Magnesium and cobalt efflux protein CorC n=1 Tax=Geodia barretti TaxID=519541 RepID=A0AA35XBV0_GEOBA|nr:Magnesium and cobalt efflux protein CorC [Geodia barretti]